jgi:transglutaminase-like putative cysteine protease
MRHLAFVFLYLNFLACFGQGNGFPYGQATYRELEIKQYDADSSAVALVLDEFGEAYINHEYNLVFEYHARIKILKPEGLSYGTFEIPLRKSEGRLEKILSVKGSSFNIENGSMKESKLEPKNIFTSNLSKYFDAKKFAIPNVKLGSVIEVQYVLESPFLYNFRSWEFQSEIPKLKSEYWCLIPANYIYNISLKGFLSLTTNESKRVTECFGPGNAADCARLKYGIKNIPAFREEDYMTAKSNFLSSVNFELSQINYFDGRKDRITKEWKDADEELRLNSEFGLQIKRGKDVLDKEVEKLVAGEQEELIKAKRIYGFIKEWYRWNNVYGKYSEFGIKKAFESKTGNVGDINLSLIAALKYAGLAVEPVLLSTRENGLVTELYPVLSDFNYVIAKVDIAGKTYLLDATDDFHPFGLIPERCLNGKGRVLGDKESYWYDLKPAERERTIAIVNVALSNTGMKGSIQYSYTGYAGVNERRTIAQFSDLNEYVNAIKNRLEGLTVTDFKLENFDNDEKPLVVNLVIDVDMGDLSNGNAVVFSPFIIEQWKRNPFRSTERLYPVDFGAPLEEILILNLVYPSEYELDEIPPKVALAMPNNGGRYTFEIQNASNKLSMNNSLLIGKPVFSSHEYHYLKELFNNVIATQQTQLVFKKKK